MKIFLAKLLFCLRLDKRIGNIFEILSSTIPRIFRSSLKSYNKFCDFTFNTNRLRTFDEIRANVKRTFINSDFDAREKCSIFLIIFVYSLSRKRNT